MSLADELGIDVPKTLCFDSVTQIDEAAIAGVSYPCYLKAAISVAGVGIYRCDSKPALMSNLHNFTDNTAVQIQEEIKTDLFLNLQYQVVGKKLFRVAASEQILDGFAHQGNRVPARYEPWRSVDGMAIWLKDHGIKGIFAFDVAVTHTEDGVRFPAIECNPRFNGATYPTLIAKKLGISAWKAVTYATEFRTLKDIDLNGIEYNKDTGEGVILVNWGTILEGKLVVLIAGSGTTQNDLELELAARL